MNPAEEIVKFWLQNKGYFIQSSIGLPKRKEIDILAINKKGDKLHIEVSVSINSINSRDPKALALKEYKNKFKSVNEGVEAILGKRFQRIYVRGRINRGRRDIREEYIKEMDKKYGVKILKFEDILKEVSDGLSTRSYLNPIIKTVQLCGFLNDRF